MRIVEYIKKYRIFNVICILSMAIMISGCSNNDYSVDDAYKIRNSIDISENKEYRTEDTTELLNDHPNLSNAVDFSEVKFIEPKERLVYNGMEMEVEDIKLAESVYEVYSLMNEEKAFEYCEQLIDGKIGNGSINNDGTAHENQQLAFIKCSITNSTLKDMNIEMMPSFYVVDDRNQCGLVSCFYLGFSGEHKEYYNSKIGVSSLKYYSFAPGETIDTVFTILFNSSENMSGNFFRYCDYNVYMSSDFLSERSSKSKLNEGGYLIHLFDHGKCVD